MWTRTKITYLGMQKLEAVTSNILLDFKQSPQRPQTSIIARQANMFIPPDFALKISKAFIAEPMSCFFPNSSNIEQNKSWECEKTLAYLKNHILHY